MFTRVVFWPWFTFGVFLVCGLVLARGRWFGARGLQRWIELGPVFVAAPLAGFAGEHFVIARFMAPMVPGWMPVRLFWVYFVGFALLAAATSLVAMRFVPLSATMLGVLFLLIVFMIHLPNAIADPRNRLAWMVVLRETAFAGGAWALAGSYVRAAVREPGTGRRNWMILMGRFSMAFAVIYFGVVQVIHPEFTPGVPDVRLTPTWVPLHAMWGYPVGAILVVAGAALLINMRPRAAAGAIGVVMTLLTVLLFLPILLLTRDVTQMTDAFNYVADTLLFGGTALLVAGALARKSPRAADSATAVI